MDAQFEPLWTVQDVAAYLQVPRATIYQWRCKHYGPPARRVGRYLRFDRAAVVEWLDQQTRVA